MYTCITSSDYNGLTPLVTSTYGTEQTNFPLRMKSQKDDRAGSVIHYANQQYHQTGPEDGIGKVNAKEEDQGHMAQAGIKRVGHTWSQLKRADNRDAWRILGGGLCPSGGNRCKQIIASHMGILTAWPLLQ